MTSPSGYSTHLPQWTWPVLFSFTSMSWSPLQGETSTTKEKQLNPVLLHVKTFLSNGEKQCMTAYMQCRCLTHIQRVSLMGHYLGPKSQYPSVLLPVKPVTAKSLNKHLTALTLWGMRHVLIDLTRQVCQKPQQQLEQLRHMTLSCLFFTIRCLLPLLSLAIMLLKVRYSTVHSGKTATMTTGSPKADLFSHRTQFCRDCLYD